MRRSSASIAMLGSGLSALPPGNTGASGPASERSSAACRIATRVAPDSGTRCSRLAFIRPAGTVQMAPARSMSPHVAPIASPVLAAVRMARRSASATPHHRPARYTNVCQIGKFMLRSDVLAVMPQGYVVLAMAFRVFRCRAAHCRLPAGRGPGRPTSRTIFDLKPQVPSGGEVNRSL
jgi:hypothetical protein